MTNIFTKTALGAALAATALVSATPASAQGYYGHRDHGDGAGAAIAGGIIGLALGAIIVSSSHHHDHDRYDRGYYNNGYNGGGYYNQGQVGYYNGYNNGYYNNQYRGHDNDRRGYDNDRGDYRRGY